MPNRVHLPAFNSKVRPRAHSKRARQKKEMLLLRDRFGWCCYDRCYHQQHLSLDKGIPRKRAVLVRRPGCTASRQRLGIRLPLCAHHCGPALVRESGRGGSGDGVLARPSVPRKNRLAITDEASRHGKTGAMGKGRCRIGGSDFSRLACHLVRPRLYWDDFYRKQTPQAELKRTSFDAGRHGNRRKF